MEWDKRGIKEYVYAHMAAELWRKKREGSQRREKEEIKVLKDGRKKREGSQRWEKEERKVPKEGRKKRERFLKKGERREKVPKRRDCYVPTYSTDMWFAKPTTTIYGEGTIYIAAHRNHA